MAQEKLMSNDEVERLFGSGKYALKTSKSNSSARLSERKLTPPIRVSETFKGKDNRRYLIRYMSTSNKDLNAVTNVFREGFPELYKSVFEAFVKPVELQKIADRYKVLVVESESGEIVASSVVELDETNMSASWHVITVIPELRGRGIFKNLATYTDKYFKETGIDYASLVASTFQEENQLIFERLGFNAVGVYHGLILAPNGDGTYNRQPVSIYEKWYKPSESFMPKSYHLTEKGRNLEEVIGQLNN